MKELIVRTLSVLLMGTLLIMPVNSYQVQAVEREPMVLEEGKCALREVSKNKDIMAVVYLTEGYPVRSSASISADVVAEVKSGQTVVIRDAERNEEQEVWCKVSFWQQEQEYTGYIQRENLACSDEVFLEWEKSCGMNSGQMPDVLTEGESNVYADVEQFPESYREALNALKKEHPNWIFAKMETGLEWKYVVEQELIGGRSLIPTSLAGYLQEGKFSNGWAYATKEALEYYLDPRNGLTEKEIFQFEQLTFNTSYHMECESAVQGFLNNTFMSGNVPQTVMTYAHVFWAIGKELNISPFHLASRVYQEQGKGTSPLISGTYQGYEGYYNYFNVGASGKTNREVIENGLAYAKRNNWSSPYLSLYYGSKVIGSNYISKGQDTIYLQKFDVDNSHSGMFWHQYMQNICAPSSEAVSIRKLYMETGSLDNVFVFKIPVYVNMPDTACSKPTSSDRVILSVPKEYEKSEVYIDGINYMPEKRNGYSIVSGTGLSGKSAIMYRYNDSGVPVGMAVWTLQNAGNYYVATRQEGLEDLVSYHGFSTRITGNAGLRVKSGIATETKEKLIKEGIAGYTLKEYGTLVMKESDRVRYPMIYNGNKVTAGISYGRNQEGKKVDHIFETVSDRQRFTSVLVGIPPKNYKTDYTFRGYVVLTKGEEDMVLYGPIVSRSIYTVAQQALNLNLYEEGSEAWQFLKKLIEDGDNAAGR